MPLAVKFWDHRSHIHTVFCCSDIWSMVSCVGVLCNFLYVGAVLCS